jgi:predicted metal-binding membrane protein
VVIVTAGAPALRQLTLPASVLLIAGGAAWAGVMAVARGMGAMPGTMGLSFGAFAGVWALMMTAMMLPSTAPFAALYTRTMADHRPRRIAELATGYLLVWAAAAGPAYALAWLAGELAGTRPAAARVMAVAIFAACGIYQLTPLKDRCLARCRSPLGFVLKYGSYRGPVRDLRVGLNHGAFCVACCWALMAVLVAAGLMNLTAMVALAAVVVAEKTWRRGPALSRAVGVAALILAVAVALRPSLAPGLHPPPAMPGGITHGALSAG